MTLKSTKKQDTFDVCVIGCGTGGLRTAIALSRAGLKTAVIEHKKVGGTCLNTGCIPTKALLEYSSRFQKCRKLKEKKIIKNSPSLNFSNILKSVKELVQRGYKPITPSLQRSGATLIKGSAKFISPTRISVGSKLITAKKFVICTGSQNIIPKILGLTKNSYLTNENILHIKSLPKTLAIIGGGYIALEFATFFSQLGTKVTIIEEMPMIMPALDNDIRFTLLESLKKEGIVIHTDCLVKKIEKKKNKSFVYVNISRKTHKTISTDALFVACGRKPNIQTLSLENTKVKITKAGGIKVNSALCTTQNNIYAIGDVLGENMFAHTVRKQSNVIVYELTKKGEKKSPSRFVPWALFTYPSVCGMGQMKGNNTEYWTASFKRNGKATIINQIEGFIKLSVHKKTRKIIGVQGIGPHAEEVVQIVTTLMQTQKITIDGLRKVVFIHPTLSEVFVNLKKTKPK